MLNELIPNMSRHFLYSLLEHDQRTGMEIIETIEILQPEQVGEFLYSLGNCLAAYFFDLEAGLKDYDKIRIQVLKDLKNKHQEEAMEDFN